MPKTMSQPSKCATCGTRADKAPWHSLKAAPRHVISAEEDETDDDEDPFADVRDSATSAVVVKPQPKAAASSQAAVERRTRRGLAAQEQLRRLPRARLTELRITRDCLDQAASLYESELHTLNDGSTLMLFHTRTAAKTT